MENYILMYDYTDDEGYTNYGVTETVTAETWIDLQEKYINPMRKDWHGTKPTRQLPLQFYCLRTLRQSQDRPRRHYRKRRLWCHLGSAHRQPDDRKIHTRLHHA